jgi:hypothetical protein
MSDTDFYNLNLRRSYPLQEITGDQLLDFRGFFVDFGVVFFPPALVSGGTTVYLFDTTYTEDNYTWRFGVRGHPSLEIRFVVPTTTSRFETYWVNVRSNGVEDGSYGRAFLVIGKGTPMVDMFPSGSSSSSSSSSGCSACWEVEPRCVQTLDNHYVTSITCANDARTLANDPCASSSSAGAVADTLTRYVAPRCENMTGDLRFVEGYNCSIVVNDVNNSLRFSARVGAGQGSVCHEVAKTEAEETAQENNQWLDNALRCDEVMYSINGVRPNATGDFQLLGGRGIQVRAEDGDIIVQSRLDLQSC